MGDGEVENNCFSSKNAKMFWEEVGISSKNAKLIYCKLRIPARMPSCAERQARRIVVFVRVAAISGVTV
jgi:hypothetical protein